jgi:hypothetical protein
LFTFFLTTFTKIGQITIIGKQVYDMTGRKLDLGLSSLVEHIQVSLDPPTPPVRTSGLLIRRFRVRVPGGVLLKPEWKSPEVSSPGERNADTGT